MDFESEVLQRLSVIETKLSNGFVKTLDDHENRVRFLEKGFWKAIGALLVLEIIGLTAIKILFK